MYKTGATFFSLQVAYRYYIHSDVHQAVSTPRVLSITCADVTLVLALMTRLGTELKLYRHEPRCKAVMIVSYAGHDQSTKLIECQP